MASCGRSHLTVAFGRASAEQCRNCAVWLEVGNNRAEIGFEVTELDAEVVVYGTLGIVGSELGIACEVADALLVSDSGAAGHKLKRVADTDNREHKEVGAIFHCGFLILLESE